MTGDRSRNATRAPEPETGPYRAAPHSDEAEASLLGAALLSSDAVATLVTVTRPEDFFRPSYATIARAIGALFAAGTAVDPITVADHLRRAKLLEDVGGPAELLTLQTGAPGTSNAPHYARIVHDYATLRRLIAAGTAIEDLAFDSPADVHDAVLRAQNLVAGVASQNGSRTFSNLEIADLEALLSEELIEEAPDFLTRADGRNLLYAGRMHVFQAEPSSGKTWLALLAVKEILEVGGAAAMIDYEDTKRGIVGRLLALGADPAAVKTRFAYVQPNGPIGQAEKLELGALFERLNPDLVVIDSVTEALSRDGYSEDKAPEVVAWTDNLPRWITRTGAAVLMLDHVSKDPEHRGRWARGSGAKLGVVDGAAYLVKVPTSFARHRSGLLKLVIVKDKPGGVGAIGETAAVAVVDPHGDGARVVIRLETDSSALHVGDAWRPTILMARLSEALADSTVPLTARSLKSLVRSEKPKLVEEALARLLAEGYVREETRGSAKTLVLVRPFEDADHHPARADHGEPPELDEPPPGLFDHEPPPHDLEAWKEQNL